MSSSEVISSCFEATNGLSFQFTAFIDQPRSFHDSLSFCSENNLELATIKDEQINTQILIFIQQVVDQINKNGANPSNSNGFFIGLSKEVGLDGFDPNSFSYVDNDPIANFANTSGEFPWFPGVPNSVTNDEACVVALHSGTSSETFWFNFDCYMSGQFSDFFSLCQIECEQVVNEDKFTLQNIIYLITTIIFCCCFMISICCYLTILDKLYAFEEDNVVLMRLPEL